MAPPRLTVRAPTRRSATASKRLRFVAEGLLNKQIATSLGMGERTVKARLTSAMNKLGVDNRTHVAVVAVQRGLM